VGPAANSLSTVGGALTERTPASGPGVDFSDSPQYIDPTSGFSNSGAGDRWVSGRFTSLAAGPGVLYAGAADGGVWRSNDGGSTWTPIFDNQGTTSIGALLVVGSTLYVGTGEQKTISDS
jgi:hypothetical protein